MKSKFMIMLGAMLLTLASCGSNDDPKPDNGSVDNADIDYNEKNAASWGNYMVQVASLLRTDADNLYKAWTEKYENGEPFAETFRKHDDASYPSVRSCVEELVDYCANIANEVGTAKIGEPYNLHVAGNTTEAVYAVESWYSWHSREDYTNNIHSIRNSYFGSLDGTVSPNSLSALVASEDADFDSKVKEAISKASASILAIPQPFRNNIGRDESVAAMEACADLEQILSASRRCREWSTITWTTSSSRPTVTFATAIRLFTMQWPHSAALPPTTRLPPHVPRGSAHANPGSGARHSFSVR